MVIIFQKRLRGPSMHVATEDWKTYSNRMVKGMGLDTVGALWSAPLGNIICIKYKAYPLVRVLQDRPQVVSVINCYSHGCWVLITIQHNHMYYTFLTWAI